MAFQSHGGSGAGRIAFKAPEEVEIRGTRNGLVIVLDARFPADHLVRALKAKLLAARDFFQGATCELHWRPTAPATGSVEVTRVLAEHGLTLRTGGEKVGESAVPPRERSGRSAARLNGEAFLFRGVLRGGQSLVRPDHVVIMGHVNPGAVVEAGGHVLVLGKLQGTVRAGWPDNSGAVIIAWHLATREIAIAGHPLSPGGDLAPGPNLVRLHRGRMRVEAWGLSRSLRFPAIN